MEFSKLIGELLSRKGISKRQLAIVLEISPNTIYAWFKQNSVPGYEINQRLFDLYGDDIRAILKSENNSSDMVSENSPPYQSYMATPVPDRYRDLIPILDKLDDTQLAMIKERAATLAELNGGHSFGSSHMIRHA
jgi:transcriptional regulator with XRE-family HTH domain